MPPRPAALRDNPRLLTTRTVLSAARTGTHPKTKMSRPEAAEAYDATRGGDTEVVALEPNRLPLKVLYREPRTVSAFVRDAANSGASNEREAGQGQTEVGHSTRRYRSAPSGANSSIIWFVSRENASPE